MPYYVSAVAAGGGDGSPASPWTLDEFCDGPAGIDDTQMVHLLGDGTHVTSRSSWNAWAANNPVSGPVGGHATIDATSAGRVLVSRSASMQRIKFTANIEYVGLGTYAFMEDVHTEIGKTLSTYARGTMFRCSAGLLKPTTTCIECFSYSDIDPLTAASETRACVSLGSIKTSNNFDRNAAHCVSLGGYDAFTTHNHCLALGAAAGFDYSDGSLARALLTDCMAAGCTADTIPATTALLGDPVRSVAADPFVDAANLNFRLTADAKASPEAKWLRKLMASLVNVPQITTDPLNELMAPTLGTPDATGDWQ